MKVVKVDGSNAVLIQDGDIQAWVDVWIEDGDVAVDWNKYIFHLTNPEDVAIKEWQENASNFEEATSLAIDHLEYIGVIAPRTDGTWIEFERKKKSDEAKRD